MGLWMGALLWRLARIGCCRAVVGAIGGDWRGIGIGGMDAIAWQVGAAVEEAC